MTREGTKSIPRVPESLTRYDQDLRRAKNGSLPVRFTLAYPANFTDDEAEMIGQVLEVDKFSIQILLEDARRVWISKPMIVGTEVL